MRASSIKKARERNSEIKALYRDNVLTGEEIALRFGVSANWVRHVSGSVVRVKRTRIERNRLRAEEGLHVIGKRSCKPKPHVSRAAQMYAEGKGSYSDIAKKLRISRNAVAGAVYRAKGLS